MSDEESQHGNEPASASRRALSGLAGHVDHYKNYLKQLKTGTSSGISGVFGGAKELLPTDCMDDSAQGRSFDETKSILPEGAPSGILRQALEQVITVFHQGQPSADGSAVKERHVIGEFLEDGRKLLVYSDMSIEDAPSSVPQASVPSQQETDASPVAHSALERTESAAKSDFDEVESDRFAKSNLEERAAGSSVPAETSTFRIANARGDLLWDVFVSNGEVCEVRLFDGTIILRADDHDKFVLVPTSPEPGQTHRAAQLIKSVILDPDSGNVFFQILNGRQAVALLNNGYRIDQYPGQDSEDNYFITEPAKPGQLVRNKMKVKNLTMDPDAGTVSYETTDGGMYVTLRYQKLS